jgi:superfamily II DNA/RNA helicase
MVVNYDLAWAIIRLIQRAGRVDRIGQLADEIQCYTFLPAEGVERIIRLRARVRQRLQENAEVVGTDETVLRGRGQRPRGARPLQRTGGHPGRRRRQRCRSGVLRLPDLAAGGGTRPQPGTQDSGVARRELLGAAAHRPARRAGGGAGLLADAGGQRRAGLDRPHGQDRERVALCDSGRGALHARGAGAGARVLPPRRRARGHRRAGGGAAAESQRRAVGAAQRRAFPHLRAAQILGRAAAQARSLAKATKRAASTGPSKRSTATPCARRRWTR